MNEYLDLKLSKKKSEKKKAYKTERSLIMKGPIFTSTITESTVRCIPTNYTTGSKGERSLRAGPRLVCFFARGKYEALTPKKLAPTRLNSSHQRRNARPTTRRLGGTLYSM